MADIFMTWSWLQKNTVANGFNKKDIATYVAMIFVGVTLQRKLGSYLENS